MADARVDRAGGAGGWRRPRGSPGGRARSGTPSVIVALVAGDRGRRPRRSTASARPRFWRFVVLEIIPIALIALPMTLVVITGEIDLSVASVARPDLHGLRPAVGVGRHLAAAAHRRCAWCSGAVLGAVNGAVRHRCSGCRRSRSRSARSRCTADWRSSCSATGPSPTTRPPGPAARSRRSRARRSRGRARGGRAGAWSSAWCCTPRRSAAASTRSATTPRPPRFAGISVARTKFWLFVVTGAISALAGVFWTLRFASARADNGTGLELAVVAAVLLGGVSIFGGRGGLVGVLAAVVLLGTLRNALQLADVPANTLTIVTGSLLIASVVGPNVVSHDPRTAARDAAGPTAQPPDFAIGRLDRPTDTHDERPIRRSSRHSPAHCASLGLSRHRAAAVADGAAPTAAPTPAGDRHRRRPARSRRA